MDVIECGIRNVGGGSHICAALQMLFHVPEVCEFILNDTEHRERCRSLLCGTCALFKQLMDVRSNRCTTPSFFLDWWKRMCARIPQEKHGSSYEFLFRLLTAVRLEHCKRVEYGKRDSIWETMTSKLFVGRQLIRMQCNQCNPADLRLEFLSVEIQLKDQNLSGEIEKKLYETEEGFYHLCNEITLQYDPLTMEMPRYLIVHASNLNGAQVQYVTVCGEDFVLKSCIPYIYLE